MAQPPVAVHPEAIAEAGAAYGWYRERNAIAAGSWVGSNLEI